MKKFITMALILSFISSASAQAFAAEKTAGPTDERKLFPTVEAVSVVIPKSDSEVLEEMADRYTIPGGIIKATEEDIRKSEEAKQRGSAQKQQARVVYISDAPLIPVMGERNSSVREEVSDRYTVPDGIIKATEEDIRKSEEAKQRGPAEKQPARRVIISDTPVPPALGEQQADEESLAERLDEEGIMPRTFWYSLDMYYYGQEERLSCGPACVRMVLRYLTGNSYTEKTIRENTCYDSDRGTRMGDLVDYMNAELEQEEYYRTHFKESKDTMRDCIYSSIANYSDPVIISVIPKFVDGSPYSGEGRHALTVYGCTSDKERVAVCDPWADYINDVVDHRCYLLDMDALYNGYEAADAGFAS